MHVQKIPLLTGRFYTPLRSVEPHLINNTGNYTQSEILASKIQMLKPSISIPQLEQKIHDRINQERENQGLEPLLR